MRNGICSAGQQLMGAHGGMNGAISGFTGLGLSPMARLYTAGCATVHYLMTGGANLPREHWRSAAAADEPLERIDPFGIQPHEHTSEHFAIRWGDSAPVDLADVTYIADLLEVAWVEATDGLGHAAPIGSDRFYRSW